MSTKRHLTCAVCGAAAGYFEQHHNRDTGFGICKGCVHWLYERGTTAIEMERNYGRSGVNYENNEQYLDAMAKQFNVDRSALQSLFDFLKHNLNTHPELRELADNHPDQFMEQGVKAWHEASTKFLGELAYGTSDAAIAMRQELASQVWTEIRTKAGLPT